MILKIFNNTYTNVININSISLLKSWLEFSLWEEIKSMSLKRLKISTKINLLVGGIILFLTITIGLVAQYEINKVMKELFLNRVKIVSTIGYNWLDQFYKGDWSIKDGNLYKGSTKINNNNEFVDQLGKVTGGAVTIFQGPDRIATNVMNNGQRVVGTKADPKVIDVVLKGGQQYIGEADIVGRQHLTMYQPIENKNGEVIGMWLVGPPIDVITNTVSSLLTKFIVVLLIGGLVAIVCCLLLTRAILRPIQTINKQLKEISDGEGDLTKELSIESQDEIGDLASSFNKMLMSLRTLIRQINFSAEQVAASSEELMAITEQTTQTTNGIARSIQEIASGAEIQGQGAEDSARTMQEMTSGVQRVAESASVVSEAAIETNKGADQGNESLQKLIRQMNTINVSTDDTASVIKQLGERSKEIGKIIEVITGIADQTNLLALNAAIEAARAGEHGRGFTIVASEVRTLAEQSKQSADQIAGLIQEIQRGTERAVEVMQKGTQEVAVGMTVVQDTGKGFQHILKSIENVANQIQEVSAVSEEMSACVEQVHTSIDEMARIAKDSAANTQSVAANSEEQLASMEEITSSASSLAMMAEDLRTLIGKFKV